MTIRNRLWLSFLSISALFALNLLVHFWGNHLRNNTVEGLQRTMLRRTTIDSMRQKLSDIKKQVALMDEIAPQTSKSGAGRAEIAKFDHQLDTIRSLISQLHAASDPGSNGQVVSFQRAYARLAGSWHRYYVDLGRNPARAVIELATRADPLSDELLLRIDALERQENRQVQSASARYYRVARLTECTTLGLFAFSTLLAIVVACAVSSSLTKGLGDLARGAALIGAGNLGYRIPIHASDELADLGHAFNDMSGRLLSARTELETVYAQLAQRHRELQERDDALREANLQLVQSAKLASLGTLSAGMAHELNQPVAIIRGISQQLGDDPALGEEAREDLALIEAQTSRMMKIIKHLRTFCRAGRGDLEEVDVDHVARECFILVGEQLRSHDIEVAFDLRAETAAVLADANELEQVILNLITNARDALDGRTGARITLRSRVEGPHYLLQVRDNGPGIPADLVERVFDPFFTTKEPGQGTGLGLSISHSIIQKHHGTLTVANEGGCVFTIALPLAEAEEPAASTAAVGIAA